MASFSWRFIKSEISLIAFMQNVLYILPMAKICKHHPVHLFYRPQDSLQYADWLAKGYSRYAVCKQCRKIGWIAYNNKVHWWRETAKIRKLLSEAEEWNQIILNDTL